MLPASSCEIMNINLGKCTPGDVKTHVRPRSLRIDYGDYPGECGTLVKDMIELVELEIVSEHHSRLLSGLSSGVNKFVLPSLPALTELSCRTEPGFAFHASSELKTQLRRLDTCFYSAYYDGVGGDIVTPSYGITYDTLKQFPNLATLCYRAPKLHSDFVLYHVMRDLVALTSLHIRCIRTEPGSHVFESLCTGNPRVPHLKALRLTNCTLASPLADRHTAFSWIGERLCALETLTVTSESEPPKYVSRTEPSGCEDAHQLCLLPRLRVLCLKTIFHVPVDSHPYQLGTFPALCKATFSENYPLHQLVAPELETLIVIARPETLDSVADHARTLITHFYAACPKLSHITIVPFDSDTPSIYVSLCRHSDIVLSST
jgi:hypothetical protein